MLLAQVDISNTTINPVAKFKDIGTFVNFFIPVASLGAAVLFLVMMLYGAFVIITAEGNPEHIKKAQKIFTFSILGLVIVTVAYLIVQIINRVTNVSLP